MHRHHSRAAFYAVQSIGLTVLFFIVTWSILFSSFLHDFIKSIDETVQVIFITPPSSVIFCMSIVTHLADPSVIIILQSLVLAILVIKYRDYLSIIFLSGMIGGEALALILKELIARSRPSNLQPISQNLTYAYPSAHALTATILYGFLAVILIHTFPARKKIIGSSAVIIIFFIGFSRLALGLHWFSDVLAGWLMGGAVLMALLASVESIHAWRKDRHPRRHTIYTILGIAFLFISILTGLYLAAYARF